MFIARAPIERNNPIGYTQSNLVNTLSGCSVLIAKIVFVGFPTKMSPSVKKIPNTIKALQNAEKRISLQIFLFSVLLIEEKKLKRKMITVIRSPTKCKSKL